MKTKAYLLRGLTTVMSNGLKYLPESVQCETFVGSYTDADKILAEIQAGGIRPILVGHSQGANAAVRIANLLADPHAPVIVPLLFTICPVIFGHQEVAYNVKRCINATTSIWSSNLYRGVGMTGHLENVPTQNWHVGITFNKGVQAWVTSEVNDAVKE